MFQAAANACFLFLTFLLFAAVLRASEPQVTTDFFVANASAVSSDYFVYSGLRSTSKPTPGSLALGPAFNAQFPALTGLGLSYVTFAFGPGAVVPPHHHPRGSELIYIIQGAMDVGFVDSSMKLYSKTLYAGDLFVFPIGLIHYQMNPSTKYNTLAISALSHSNPGLIFTPGTLLVSGIPTQVLAASLKVKPSVIRELQAALGM